MLYQYNSLFSLSSNKQLQLKTMILYTIHGWSARHERKLAIAGAVVVLEWCMLKYKIRAVKEEHTREMQNLNEYARDLPYSLLERSLMYLWCHLNKDTYQKDTVEFAKTISELKNALENAAQGACFEGNVDALEHILDLSIRPTEEMMSMACSQQRDRVIECLQRRGLEISLKNSIIRDLAAKRQVATRNTS